MMLEIKTTNEIKYIGAYDDPQDLFGVHIGSVTPQSNIR